jgi:hypothetical protein
MRLVLVHLLLSFVFASTPMLTLALFLQVLPASKSSFKATVEDCALTIYTVGGTLRENDSHPEFE